MSARIRSTVNGINPIDELSRNDLVAGDSVVVTSIDAATTYAWELSFVPEGSTAAFTGSPTAVSPGNFVVDLEGPYLVKLTVDAGLASEDVQYVRLRALTTALGLQLVAAGERRDGTGIIPVDIDIEGWANEQNSNLQALEAAIQANRPTLISKRFDFDFNTTAANIIDVDPGDVVVKFYVNFEQAFDDVAATISVGDSGDPDRFILASDMNTNTTNKYEIPTIDSISTTTNITYNPNVGVSTQGSGFILALIHKSYS